MMLCENKISVIVPVFNVERYIHVCLEALIKQTYRNIEVLLVDDGSTDGSGKICDEYSLNYSFIKCIHKINGGVSSARNVGLINAQGDYIAFVDPDDSMDCNMYEILIDSIEKNNCDLVGCEYTVEYGNLPIKMNQSIEPKSDIVDVKDQCMTAIFSGKIGGGFLWNKVFKRDLIHEKRFDEKIHMGEDMLFVWEALKDANKVCTIREQLYHYRYTFSSTSKHGKLQKMKTCLGVWEKIKKDIDAFGFTDRVICRWATNYIAWNIKVCECMLINGEFDNEVYQSIQHNIQLNISDANELTFRLKILSKAIEKSWVCYSILAWPLYYAKYLYVRYKQLKTMLG